METDVYRAVLRLKARLETQVLEMLVLAMPLL
jgi:hypothetical protein